MPSPGARVEEVANELSKVETIPVLHIFQRNIVIEEDTTTITLPGCRDRLQPRIRGGARRRNHRRSCLPHGSRYLSCLCIQTEQLCHKAGLHLGHEEVCSICRWWSGSSCWSPAPWPPSSPSSPLSGYWRCPATSTTRTTGSPLSCATSTPACWHVVSSPAWPPPPFSPPPWSSSLCQLQPGWSPVHVDLDG